MAFRFPWRLAFTRQTLPDILVPLRYTRKFRNFLSNSYYD